MSDQNPSGPLQLNWLPGPVPRPETMPPFACAVVWRNGLNGTAPEIAAIMVVEDPAGNKHWIYDRAGQGSDPLLPLTQDWDIDEDEWTPPEECAWWAFTGQSDVEVD